MPGLSLNSYDSHAAAEVVQGLLESGMYARVLGNVAYVMVSPTTQAEVCSDLMSTVSRIIAEIDDGRPAFKPDVVAYSI